MEPREIYLDYNASTPIASEVADVMSGLLSSGFGNPSSQHWAGAPAREALERARQQVADLLGCLPSEVVFTSGGSEANNMVLKGMFWAKQSQKQHVIISQVEHPAIEMPCQFLESQGVEVTRLPVDGTGQVNPEDLKAAIRPHTSLVSIMHSNNETGTLQPIGDCAAIARAHGIAFHTDAAQSVGKVSTHVEDLGVDFMSLAGHKFYAPKGIGALYIRDGFAPTSLIHGAGHEAGRRAGTESALMAAALGEAARLASDLKPTLAMQDVRDLMWALLFDAFGAEVMLNGHETDRLPNTLNVSFVRKVGSKILGQLDGVAASTGSACHEGSVELSPVLKAMGVSEHVGMGAIRFSLGRTTSEADIRHVVERLKQIVPNC
jgi:cysteine desulfurase